MHERVMINMMVVVKVKVERKTVQHRKEMVLVRPKDSGRLLNKASCNGGICCKFRM